MVHVQRAISAKVTSLDFLAHELDLVGLLASRSPPKLVHRTTPVSVYWNTHHDIDLRRHSATLGSDWSHSGNDGYSRRPAYLRPKKLNIAITMTTAPTSQMILFMISLLLLGETRTSGGDAGRSAFAS